MRILDGIYQTLKGGLIGNDVAGLDLNNEARTFETKTAAPCDDVDALVRTGRRYVHKVTLDLQDFRDKAGKIMPRERTRDTSFDLIPRDLVKINFRVFCGWGFRGCRGSWWSCNAALVARVASGLENRLDTRESIMRLISHTVMNAQSCREGPDGIHRAAHPALANGPAASGYPRLSTCMDP
jgi:hypothetical protein